MYKILVIDDSLNICLLTKAVLKDIADWEALIAVSGEEGLAIAQREQPDAILLDVRMPVMDGMMLLEQLKANSETQSIPVILFTGEEIGTQIVAQLPIVGVIFKPFEAGDLVKQIRSLLNWYE